MPVTEGTNSFPTLRDDAKVVEARIAQAREQRGRYEYRAQAHQVLWHEPSILNGRPQVGNLPSLQIPLSA